MLLSLKSFRVAVVTFVAAMSLTPIPAAGQNANDEGPRIVAQERTVALGRIQEGEKATARFVIENQGTRDLHIERVQTSCGCTVPRKLTPDEKRVEPGETLSIEAVFNSRGRRGKQRKSVTVHSDDEIEPNLKLFLTAEVVTLFEVLIDDRPARRLTFGKLLPGDAVSNAVDILPTAPRKTLDIESLEIRHPALTYTTEPLSKDDRTGVRVKLLVDPDAAIGQVSTSLLVKGRVDDQRSESYLAVSGEVIGLLNFRPITIKRMQPALPGNALPTLMISSNGRDPFEVLGADAGDQFDVSVEERTPSQYAVKLVIRDGAPPGPCGTFLDVRTNMVDQPLVRVPVYASVLPLVSVEPPVLLLRAGVDGKSERTVKIESSAGETLQITEISVDQSFLTVESVESPGRQSSAFKHLLIKAASDAPRGTHQATVRVRTSIAGASEVTVPVTVLVQ